MKNVKFVHLDFKDDAQLRTVAIIHESAPLNWDPAYKVTEPRISFWIDFLRKLADDRDSWVTVAKSQSGEIIGVHWIRMIEKHGIRCATIDSLWVSEKDRGMGIGAELKRLGEAWAKSRGAKFISTEVFYTNKKMIDFNLKLGFATKQVEMIKDL